MKSAVWTKAVKNSADPLRARHGLDLLAAAGAADALHAPSPEQARILCAVFSGSQALSAWLVAHPGALPSLAPELLAHPRRDQGFRREVGEWLATLLETRDYSTAFTRLRQFKQREILRIAARDLARLGRVNEIIRELSDLADVCLDAVWQLCRQQLTERFGRPHHQDASGRWQPTVFSIFGLGKLGGQELNYSSDVDVIFVYSEEGHVFKEPPAKNKPPGATGMTSHQFFNRLVEMFVAEVSRMTADGM